MGRDKALQRVQGQKPIPAYIQLLPLLRKENTNGKGRLVSMQYVILRGFGQNFESANRELESEVASFIDFGWKPQGGVSAMVTVEPGGYRYCNVLQAMVKED